MRLGIHAAPRALVAAVVGLPVLLAGAQVGAVTVSIVTTHPNLALPSSEVFSLIADCPFRPATKLSISSIPLADAVSVFGTKRLLNTATTNFNLSDSEFRFSFDHSRGDGQFSCSGSSAGDSARSAFTLVFSVDEPAEFSLLSHYQVTDESTEGMSAGFGLSLHRAAPSDTSWERVFGFSDPRFDEPSPDYRFSFSGTMLDETSLEPSYTYWLSGNVQIAVSSSRIDGTGTAGGEVVFSLIDADIDHDGVFNSFDNCIEDFNPDQSDFDRNGIGDACDEPPLPLQTPNPMNLSSLRVLVELDDGLTSVVAFDEMLPLDDVGSGRMSIEPFGVLAPGAQLNRFEINYGGPHAFNTGLGAANLPVSLTIDEAIFSVGGGVQNPLGHVELGGALLLDPSTIDATVAGSVNVDGQSAPFSLYGVGFPCGPCLAAEPNVQPSALVDDLEDVEITGLSGVNDRANALALPPDQQTTQAIPGFTVSVRAGSVVQGARFAVPEPASRALATAALLLAAGLAARMRGRS